MRRLKGFLQSRFFEILIWFFPCLFLFDDIMGTNGYQFTIFGKGIRIVLFCITCAVLIFYCLCVMGLDGITLFPGRKKKPHLFQYLKPVDYGVLFFILGNFLWATVVPFFVRGETTFALKDYSTILVLVLYFPLVFLIRTGRLKISVLEGLIYGISLLLAVWHGVMFVGETLSPGFYSAYYDFIEWLSGGTAVMSGVIYGFGIVRVIQTTSMFLLPGIFLALRYVLRGKYIHLVSVGIFLFSICATFTKSIWFGLAAGIVVYFVGCLCFCKDKKVKIRSVALLLFVVALVVVFNASLFENKLYMRVFNTIQTTPSLPEDSSVQGNNTDSNTNSIDTTVANTNSEDVSDSDSNSDESSNPNAPIDDQQKDFMGTQAANAIRESQTKALLKKWSTSRWFGFGYGSYTEECIRNSAFPYMYEATLAALLLKIGIVGCIVWLIFISSTTVGACRSFWKTERSSVFWWLGMALSYAMAVQTNPFLFTFPGFSVLLYVLLSFQKCDISRSK